MKAFFSAEDIVESLYRTLLQREADAEGLATLAAGLGARQPITLIGNCNAPILADCLRTGSNALGALEPRRERPR